MAKRKVGAKEKELTVERAHADFKKAYEAKKDLIDREHKDFLFALGEQWSEADKAALERAGIVPVTDNRVAPNLYLLTGLERQNRTDFKAFPIGEEDGVRADVATALFKDAIRKSGFAHKSSEQFKDGITCGESHLEPYLDYADSILNGKLCWRKSDGNTLFPDPTYREYDLSDAKHVYKLTLDVDKDDLLGLYPEADALLADLTEAKLSLDGLHGYGPTHQSRDYDRRDESVKDKERGGFDLIERYYKKSVKTAYVADRQTGALRAAKDRAEAEAFIANWRQGMQDESESFERAKLDAVGKLLSSNPDTAPQIAALPPDVQLSLAQEAGVPVPPAPPQKDPGRYIILEKRVPEIWVFAYVPGIEEPLAHRRAWFYPKWRQYPFIPYFARFSTAPLEGKERHLLVQGLVHGVKGAQEKHNKAEVLMLRHLNTSANSGWLAEEDSWVDPKAVKDFGTAPGVNLEYKKTARHKPERIVPAPLSQGHAQIASDAAEAIKAQLGVNSDLLATQEGGGDSGRAIALRQKQGLLMVQELFDNLTRSRELAGRMILTQLGEMYDTDSAMKVLGEAFLVKTFPPPTLINEQTGQPEPMVDRETGQPMQFDKSTAEVAIAEVLRGDLGEYDVAVGEAVASDTLRMAVSMELRDIATSYPGIVPPDVLVRNSQLPQAAKDEILRAIDRQQQMAAAAAQGVPAQGGGIPAGEI